jgi:hypothetical protein
MQLKSIGARSRPWVRYSNLLPVARIRVSSIGKRLDRKVSKSTARKITNRRKKQRSSY